MAGALALACAGMVGGAARAAIDVRPEADWVLASGRPVIAPIPAGSSAPLPVKLALVEMTEGLDPSVSPQVNLPPPPPAAAPSDVAWRAMSAGLLPFGDAVRSPDPAVEAAAQPLNSPLMLGKSTEPANPILIPLPMSASLGAAGLAILGLGLRCGRVRRIFR